MAKICNVCKKKIGLFSSRVECMYVDCNFIIHELGGCNNEDTLPVCEKCDEEYCSKHIKNHECEEVEEEEESDEEINIHYSNNKKYLFVDTDTDEYDDILDIMDKLSGEGYEYTHSRYFEDNGMILMKKKEE